MVVALLLLLVPLGTLADNHDVLDKAHVLNAETESKIEQINDDQLQKTGGDHPQIAVITVKGTGDESIEDYAQRQFDKYHFGQKGKDNGVLLVIDVKSHKVRMQTGYGMEQKLPDDYIEDIMTKQVKQKLRAKDYSTATEMMVQKIADRITGQDHHSYAGKVIDDAHVFNQPAVTNQLDRINQQLSTKRVHAQLTIYTTNESLTGRNPADAANLQYMTMQLNNGEDSHNMLLYLNPAERKIVLYYPQSKAVIRRINADLHDNIPADFNDCNQLVNAWLSAIPDQLNQIINNAYHFYDRRVDDRAGVLTTSQEKKVGKKFKSYDGLHDFGTIGLITVDSLGKKNANKFAQKQADFLYFNYSDNELFYSEKNPEYPIANDEGMLLVYDKATNQFGFHVGETLTSRGVSNRKLREIVKKAQKEHPDNIANQALYIAKQADRVVAEDTPKQPEHNPAAFKNPFLLVFLLLGMLWLISKVLSGDDDDDDHNHYNGSGGGYNNDSYYDGDDYSGGGDSFGGFGGDSGGGGGTDSW